MKYLTPVLLPALPVITGKSNSDTKVFTKSKKLWIKALEGGKQLSRNEMYAVLERARIGMANMRGLFYPFHLAHGFFSFMSLFIPPNSLIQGLLIRNIGNA